MGGPLACAALRSCHVGPTLDRVCLAGPPALKAVAVVAAAELAKQQVGPQCSYAVILRLRAQVQSRTLSSSMCCTAAAAVCRAAVAAEG